MLSIVTSSQRVEEEVLSLRFLLGEGRTSESERTKENKIFREEKMPFNSTKSLNLSEKDWKSVASRPSAGIMRGGVLGNKPFGDDAVSIGWPETLPSSVRPIPQFKRRVTKLS